MESKWTKELVEELIFNYEMLPVLWDVCSPKYKDRLEKQEAWKKLAEEMSLGVIEVQRKIHNLRNQLSQEIKKQKERSKSGQGTYVICTNPTGPILMD